MNLPSIACLAIPSLSFAVELAERPALAAEPAALVDDAGVRVVEVTSKARAYGVMPEDVDYINAHGTATLLNDKGETIAIKEVFGEHAYKVDISSTKSMLGHMLGGAGAIETMICARTITEGVIAPTINLHTQDPECDLNYTPLTAKQADVRVTLSNSFGFGGHNACIMLRRYDDAA